MKRPPRGKPRVPQRRQSANRKGVNYYKRLQANKRVMSERKSALVQKSTSLLKALILIILLSGLAGAGIWGSYRAYLSSDLLILRKVVITGTENLDRERILKDLNLELGQRMLELPIKEYSRSLAENPWISKAKVNRSLPSGLSIKLAERTPVAMGFHHGWHGLSEDGRRLPGLDPSRYDLPVVDGFALLESDALVSLGSFLQSAKERFPSLYSNFSQIKMSNTRDAEVYLRDGKLKVFIGTGAKSLNSLEFLQALLRQQGSRLKEGRTVDLRIEGYAYVR